MLTLKLAMRNMLAHGQRSLIMFLAVGLVSCFVFLFMAFSDGEIANFRIGIMAIWNPPADILVNAAGYREAQNAGEEWKITSSKSIADWPSLLPALQAQPGVGEVAVAGQTLYLDMQAGGQRYQGFWFKTFDTDYDWQVKPYISLKTGQWFAPGNQPQIMLHYKSAKSLKAQPGDSVVLNGRDLFGQSVSQAVVLRGFFAPGQDNPNLTSMGYLNPAAYDLISGFNPGETLEIAVKIKEGANRQAVMAGLAAWSKAGDRRLEFLDTETLRRDDGGIYDVIRMIFLTVSILIVFVVSFGVMSVVSVNLYDRKREIGTYYCLGSEKGFLIRLYTAEIVILNTLATLAGIALGLIVRQIINGLQLRTEEAGLQLVFGGSQFTLGFSAGSTLFLIGLMLGVTIVTALTTLGKRLKVSPVAALRDTE